MDRYARSHLSDPALLQNLTTNCGRESRATADLLADLAEVDARKLYLPAGYPSMHCYCVQELHFSEDSARKRIHAARAARGVPAVFHAVAEGRLHLSGVVLLAPWLTPENALELLAAASHKTKLEIEQLIAECFPRLDVPAMVQAIAEPSVQAGAFTSERAPGRVAEAASSPVAPPSSAPRPRVTPLAPGRFGLQFTMGQELHDKLRYAQELLGHQIPAGDVAQVFERALDALIPKLEKRKFGATGKPRRDQRRSAKAGRYIPAHVRHAVWQRDGGCCTFVSETGRRCSARRDLEFDHVQEVARGGEATVENLRLRCRAHNQYGAEQTFGAEFMNGKRQERPGAAERNRAAGSRGRGAESGKRAGAGSGSRT